MVTPAVVPVVMFVVICIYETVLQWRCVHYINITVLIVLYIDQLISKNDLLKLFLYPFLLQNYTTNNLIPKLLYMVV